MQVRDNDFLIAFSLMCQQAIVYLQRQKNNYKINVKWKFKYHSDFPPPGEHSQSNTGTMQV